MARILNEHDFVGTCPDEICYCFPECEVTRSESIAGCGYPPQTHRDLFSNGFIVKRMNLSGLRSISSASSWAAKVTGSGIDPYDPEDTRWCQHNALTT